MPSDRSDLFKRIRKGKQDRKKLFGILPDNKQILHLRHKRLRIINWFWISLTNPSWMNFRHLHLKVEPKHISYLPLPPWKLSNTMELLPGCPKTPTCAQRHSIMMGRLRILSGTYRFHLWEKKPGNFNQQITCILLEADLHWRITPMWQWNIYWARMREIKRNLALEPAEVNKHC